MKKCVMIVFIVILLICSCYAISFARSLPDLFIRSTVFIHNKSTDTTGTGFLVRRDINEKGDWQLVLISNKHVLMPKDIPAETKDKKAVATFSLNMSGTSGVTRRDIIVPLRESDGTLLVKTHPNKDVDVAGVVLPPENVFPGDIVRDGSMLNPIPEDRIMTKEMIKDNFITLGDTVLLLGYPLNMVESGNVIPIARGAVLATSPRDDFRGTPMFLIDGTIVRGSSGSPVFIPMSSSKWIEEMKVDPFKVQQSYLIGIVAATVKDWELIIRRTVMVGAPLEELTVLDTANLGIVYRGDCIIDVLNILCSPKWTKENKLSAETDVKKNDSKETDQKKCGVVSIIFSKS